MNVQGANILSLLSGSDSLGNLQQSLLGKNGDEVGFASAFLGQLGLLQNGLQGSGNPDLASLQDWIDSAKAGEAPADLKNFAAFFGKELPPVNKLSQDIDLEDTLQTLAGVLQQLQELQNGGDTELLAPTMTSEGRDIDDQAQSLSGDDQTAVDAGSFNAAVVMPISVPQPELDESTELSEDDGGLTELVAANRKNMAALKSSADSQNALADAAVNADDLATDFNRSISAMLARQGMDGKPQQDKQNVNLKAESLLSGLESQSDVENGKTLPGVAADIAKLNQAMRGDSPVVSTQQPEMAKHFTDPAWNKELGEKLIWMHKQSVPSVELRLNPEHLGPVLIKIDVNHDQANVAFTAQHLAVKEAIEAAIPKLREMLGGQQLNLVDVNVSQQQSDQRQQPREFFHMASHQQSSGQGAGSGMNGDDPLNQAQNLVDEIEAGRAVASNGLLSLFA